MPPTTRGIGLNPRDRWRDRECAPTGREDDDVADFVIPELGENVAGGDIVRVLVKPGDAIKKDQPVLELETDKATIEVPSSVAGVVKELKVKKGDKVKVGQLVLTVDESAPPPAPAKAPRRSSGAGKAARPRQRAAGRSRPTLLPPSTRIWRAQSRRRAKTRRSRRQRSWTSGAARLLVPPRPRRQPALPCRAGAASCRPHRRRAAPRASWAWTSRRSKAAVPAAASPWTT